MNFPENCELHFITFHARSTKSIGGVQFLFRDLHRMALDVGFSVVELYAIEADEGLPPIEGVSSQQVNYIRYFDGLPALSKVGGVIRRFSYRRYLSKLIAGRSGNVICLTNVYDLMFISDKILKENIVFLIQTDSVDEFISPLKLKVLKRKVGLINEVCVYTDLDKAAFEERVSGIGNKINVIPRACRFPVSKKIPPYSKRLVTVCRIEEGQKNLSAMIDVMGMLGEQYTLDIYGPGTRFQTKELKSRIRGYKNIRYLGATHDVKSALRENSVFLMTSRHEGFGQTLVQARSQGLPIVVFDTFDSARWIVSSGVNGYLVKPFDITQFADKVREVLKSEEAYRFYAENCLSSAGSTEEIKVNRQWLSLLSRYFEKG